MFCRPSLSGFAALCAILLLSFAPLVSQTLDGKRVEALFSSICTSSSNGIAHTGDTASHANHDALSHLQACGYCDLLAHAPTPPSMPHGFAASTLADDTFVAKQNSTAPHRMPPGVALPRAPPALA
ncbi:MULTISPECIES: DUF2946 domain-containing protein [unclassified Caballeronia]|uniref:DUF2946 domain-containing protein n=1 Tax=unclassified Caballeronia TaxID=2646786 RepID=UPI002854E641|nr:MULTISPECIES: DUF2946 domain-containing protein [unclassified Caballeronia]MDR5771337.1 DUF2946 domain-containing protein [Caballeronia sp. LZ002]MDR5846773.1 DUF2946 domain-containing protein [Caballeronia sp. LZ003]